MAVNHNWSVYIIRAETGALYTGITTDIRRRWRQHGSGRGARFFNLGGSPAELVFLEPGHTRSSAAKREASLKRLKRHQKLHVIESAGLGAMCWIEIRGLDPV